jgi:N-acyl-D-amino-acid deacylase
MGKILIKGGSVIDGSGKRAFDADVLIDGDRIAAIGKIELESDAEVIDATGLTVAPGFLDIHAHADFALLQKGSASQKIMQGVTTEVIGNCGIGAAPANDAVKEYFDGFLQYMFGPIETGGLTEISDYFDTLESQGIAVNAAYYIPHGIVRMHAMGMEDREPSAEEMEMMKGLVRRGMEDGAIGMSTGLIYPPGMFAKTDELIELATVVAEYDGIYASHIRDESAKLAEAMAEAIEIGEKAGVRIQIAHHKAHGKAHWGKVSESIRLIEEARARGVDITTDQYPYTASSTILAAVLSEDDDTDPADVLIAATKNDHSLEGKTLADVIAASDKTPEEAIYEMMANEEGAVTVVIFAMCEEDIATVMRHPTTFIGSDGIELDTGKPHPRVYGTFPRVLGRYVREKEILSLEEAVSKMTSLPAKKLRLRDRGLLAEGMYADVTIFDPDTIIDTATYEDPHQHPKGIHHVIVNGEIVVRDGVQTEALPGNVLRKGEGAE